MFRHGEFGLAVYRFAYNIREFRRIRIARLFRFVQFFEFFDFFDVVDLFNFLKFFNAASLARFVDFLDSLHFNDVFVRLNYSEVLVVFQVRHGGWGFLGSVRIEGFAERSGMVFLVPEKIVQPGNIDFVGRARSSLGRFGFGIQFPGDIRFGRSLVGLYILVIEKIVKFRQIEIVVHPGLVGNRKCCGRSRLFCFGKR